METVVIAVRVPASLEKTITKLASDQGRTRANFVRQLLEKEAKEYKAMMALYQTPKQEQE